MSVGRRPAATPRHCPQQRRKRHPTTRRHVHRVPSLREPANAAWQALSVLAFNLSRAFQADTLRSRAEHQPQAPRPARAYPTGSGRLTSRFESIHTLRFKLLGRAAVLLRPAGKTTLHLGHSTAVAGHFLAVANAIRA